MPTVVGINGTLNQEADKKAAAEKDKKTKEEARRRWKDVWDPVSGCAKDYAEVSPIRLFKHEGTGGNEPPEDPVDTMQRGMQVLYYNADRRVGKFEQRVLKVDDQLDFLYIMLDSSDGRAKEDSNPMVLKLDAIEAIYGTTEAIRLCDHFKIFDPHLQAESAVVLKLRMWDGAEADQDGKPHSDRVIIFISPPRQHLRACIMACKTKTEAFGAALTEAGKWRLVGVKTVDIYPVLNGDDTVSLDYHLKPDDDVEGFVPLDSHRSELCKVNVPLNSTAFKEVLNIGQRHNCNLDRKSVV